MRRVCAADITIRMWRSGGVYGFPFRHVIAETRRPLPDVTARHVVNRSRYLARSFCLAFISGHVLLPLPF